MNVDTFDKSKIKAKPMMDHIIIEDGAKVVGKASKHLEELFKGVKDIANLITTEVGQTVLKMADKEVDGKNAFQLKNKMPIFLKIFRMQMLILYLTILLLLML